MTRNLSRATVLVSIIAVGLCVPTGRLEAVPPPSPFDQVEPRTPIRDSDFGPAGFTITESGSYYLVEDVLAVNGIVIASTAEDVTLDLMGFSLVGQPGATSRTIGIQAEARINLRISNGTIRDWDTGIAVGLGKAQLTHLTVQFNRDVGIYLGQVGGEVRECTVGSNSGTGIAIANDSGITSQVVDSIIFDNDPGIDADSLSHATVRDSLIITNFGGVKIGNGLVEGCSILQNRLWGITTHNATVRNNNVEARFLWEDETGIVVNGPGIVVANTIRGFLPGLAITGGGSEVGPIQSPATATSPWANIVWDYPSSDD